MTNVTDSEATRIPLTRDRIVDAAIELIEADGPDSLSMRRLASRLGTSTMATYHHIPDRAALMEAIAERVLTGSAVPEVDDPFEVLRHQSLEFLAIARRRPATFITLLRNRPASLLDRVAEISVALIERGVSDEHAILWVRTAARFVIGSAITEFGADPAVVSPDEMRRVTTYGLDALLDGIRRSTDPPKEPSG